MDIGGVLADDKTLFCVLSVEDVAFLVKSIVQYSNELSHKIAFNYSKM